MTINYIIYFYIQLDRTRYHVWNVIHILYYIDTVYSSRFATSRPHPVNRTEKKEAGSWQLTGVKLGCPWPKLGRTRGNWDPTWRNLGTLGRKLGLTCATWSCVRATAAEVWPKIGLMYPNVGNTASHEPPSSGAHESFQRVALNPPNWAE